jgi:AraC-like DNA-binding protein
MDIGAPRFILAVDANWMRHANSGRRAIGAKGVAFSANCEKLSAMERQTLAPYQAKPGSGSVPIAFVRAICLAYAKYGADPSASLERAQIPPDLMEDPTSRVTPAQFETLSWYAMQELDDEALGWFSRKLHWGAYGMLGRASITSGTLDLALRRWTRHHRILVDDIRPEMKFVDGVAILSLFEQCDLGAFREFCLVTVLRYVLGFACWAIDVRIPLLAAQFPFPPPPHVDIYPKLFTQNLQFNASCAQISFDAAYAMRRLQRDEAALQKMLKRALPLTVLPYRRDQRLSARVQQVLRIPNALVTTAEDLAEGFHISTRTLHRQLRSENSSLRELKRQARLEQAKRALSLSDKPVKGVAFAAGFRNEKAFARAFKQWTGETPSSFRGRMRKA